MTSSNSTFAQAQARLAARRQERETEARARVAAAQSASRLRTQLATSSSPLLRGFGSSALAFWDAATSREGTRPAFRVGQVDAELLDEELLGQLRSQVSEGLRYLGGGGGGSRLGDDWAPEILLALRAVLFKLTIWDHDATYGAALQNLKYTDARNTGSVPVPPSRLQKALYGTVTVCGKYVWTKWEDWLIDQDNGAYDSQQARPVVQRLSRLTELASNIHAAGALVSFMAFLINGRYRTLLDRILRMRLAPPTSQVSREVSFEYLNRQLVWHAFTEFLLFVLPLVGINRWRKWITRTWRRTKDAITAGTGGEGEEGGEKKGEFAFLPERTCAICYQDQNSGANTEEEILAAAAASSGVIGSAQTDITNPYETLPCGCIYCFVCLATRLEREEGDGWVCLRCGEIVKECKPWSGDVLEPKSSNKRSPGAKAVTFVDDVVVVDDMPRDTMSVSDKVDASEETGPRSGEEARYRESDSSSDDGGSEAYEEEEDELGEDLRQ
ncbi:peroxisomal biogenesis factor 2 [Pyricularia oryzae 70-15]|uniref:Peroxisomal biogenesis factor 2 n=3 Tax=Pyricularia oryzae TaxID=318829 RepID=G4NB15_PYRO7|nr:peroxisomal biogenesis factor 2 [Pyricularia oryzae 70-15]EHA48777.1 peroxisomal biogenesis factor 2 [Pyricularia oryzae 70-15]ELQ44121.1 peroxisomal biogenesis factor 2 [Pyricularia oryzae Y34]KAI7925545.1 peroxisomal biogenesis factor 2 [Pyricularia oryzae]KAI7926607.1 peroxisomal biogenesis factor 2 [Pyricularia oryzae]